jgi:hypothetical protein
MKIAARCCDYIGRLGRSAVRPGLARLDCSCTLESAHYESSTSIRAAVAHPHLARALHRRPGAQGITAFPLEHETAILNRIFHVAPTAPPRSEPALNTWLRRVHEGIAVTARNYPFMAYGTDWLAFAHLVIAIAFLGPLRDPVRNKWVLVFGVIACAGVVPLAFIAGPIRGIPFFWRCIDSCFGVFGAIPLLFCLRDVRALEAMDSHAAP